MWQTFGHKNVKNILEKQLEAGKFPHAYLFSGPEGLGKKSLALEFAGKVLDTERLDAHPDFTLLDVQGEITVDVTLEFMSRLSVKPFAGKWKVAVVNNAQNLNIQSANALLKTLEEPSQSTILILVSSGGTLISTITSRCQLFAFRRLGISELNEFVKQKKLNVSKEQMAISFGLPAKLVRMATEKDFAEQCSREISELQELKSRGIGERLSLISGFAEREVADLQSLFKTWVMWEYSELRKDSSGFSGIQQLTNAISETGTNKNKKLILQSLFLKI